MIFRVHVHCVIFEDANGPPTLDFGVKFCLCAGNLRGGRQKVLVQTDNGVTFGRDLTVPFDIFASLNEVSDQCCVSGEDFSFSIFTLKNRDPSAWALRRTQRSIRLSQFSPEHMLRTAQIYQDFT